ncbi:MAG: hypothetical protein NC124_17295 [Clostridium sp.]|nr:hypothetical protein [Clostridium sp.]
MLITDEILKNIELSCISGDRLKRLKEIKELEIEYPYDQVVTDVDHFTPEREVFVSACGERILYTCAFSPMPIAMQAGPPYYDDVYLLIIDNEFFEFYLDWDFEWSDGDEYYKVLADGTRMYHWRYKLRTNEKLDRRADLRQILLLLKSVIPFENNVYWNSDGVFYTTDIIYKGEII